ncbi:Asp-tRNA(Asn)/Glu-tRNA(Gln) amidotransferase subunit GatA [Candidatus Gracilibacteria bacterium]|nr:Asp-tRNA(Asn)/Glu-tRNA(Gln) amidotransferase subunit GatA [Candidatus Gracilibacteria bacterium]
MENFRGKILELNKKLKNGEITSEKLTEEFFERIEKIDGEIGSFLTLNKEKALEQAKKIDEKGDFSNPLTGIPYSMKDLICTKGLKTTAGSKILENFVPPYNATVSDKLQNSNCLGKVNLDEFAMGSSCENSALKETKNPWDLSKVTGGSSGGSASSVASDECVFSIGTDTGGSIRQPAGFCGVVGLKPTYGRVSRFGVISYGSSFDTVGPIAKSVEDCAIVLDAISGQDGKDSTLMKTEIKNLEDENYVENLQKSLNQDIKGKKIGVIKEFSEILNGENFNQDVKNSFENSLKILKNLGAEIVEVSIPELKYAINTYYILAKSEVSSNLSKYEGIKYGVQVEGKTLDEIYLNSRTQGFGHEVKKAIMMGTFTLSASAIDAYFKKAAKVRNLIKMGFDKAFNEVDAIFAPVSPTPAFGIGEIGSDLEMYMQDIFTVPVNLVGIPSLSLPVGMAGKLPVGAQIMGKMFDEETIFNIGNLMEKEIKFERKLF